MSDLTQYTTITEDEFLESCEGEIETYGTDAVFRVYEGDITIDGDLHVEELLASVPDGEPHFGLIVLGNLEIRGRLLQTEQDVGGNFVFVMGNLEANAICKGSAAFYIRGDVDVAGTILALEHGEGAFEVGGQVRAQHLFLFEGHWAPFSVAAGTIVCSNFLDKTLEYRDLEDVVHPSALEDGKHFSSDKLKAQLLAGAPLLREDITPT